VALIHQPAVAVPVPVGRSAVYAVEAADDAATDVVVVVEFHAGRYLSEYRYSKTVIYRCYLRSNEVYIAYNAGI